MRCFRVFWGGLFAVVGFVSMKAQSVPDSVLSYWNIQNIYLRDPDYALQLLDSAEARNLPNLPLFKINRLRSMCYDMKGEYLLTEKYVRRQLEDDSIRSVPVRKLRTLTMLVNALSSQNKYEECIRYCKETVKLARELGRINSEGEVLFTMGNVYAGMNRLEESLDMYREGIDLLKNSDDVRDLAVLSTAYGELMTTLMWNKKVLEAIEIGKERERLVEHMSQMPGPPDGYIDQQYGYLYSKMAYALQLVERSEEAMHYYRQFQTTDFAHQSFTQGEIIPFLLQAGRYQEALKLNKADYEIFCSEYEKDTVNYNYYVILDRFAQAYRGLKDYKRANAYLSRAFVLNDAIYTKEKESRAQEFATVFMLNEKDLQLAQMHLVAQRRNFQMIILCIVLVLACAFLGIVLYHLQIIRRRNLVAAKQIDELVLQRDDLRRASERAMTFSSIGSSSSSNTNPKDSQKDSDDPQMNSFLRMEYRVMEERLFLQPKFGRDDLLRLCNVSKNDLPRILRQYARVNNVSDYLNHLRVEYAVRLMHEKPNLSMDGIGKEAGFNSRSTFYRAFFKEFGMTPAQYLKAHSVQEG